MAKRKEIEEAMEGFSYPESKIRRLEPKLSHPIGVPFPIDGTSSGPASKMAYTMDETVPSSTSAEDRAIVLYKPSDSSLNLGPVPSNLSVFVSPELLHNLKNQVVHQGSNVYLEDKSPAGNECLAVVPWVPPVRTTTVPHWSSSQQDQKPPVIEELSESEENTSMEVDCEQLEPHQASVFGRSGGSEGFWHQWQQQCMAPGAPPTQLHTLCGPSNLFS